MKVLHLGNGETQTLEPRTINWIGELEELGLRRKDYIITLDGTMALYGLKDNQDLDILVSREIFNRLLIDKIGMPQAKPAGNLTLRFKHINIYDLLCDETDDDMYGQTVDGYTFQPLPFVLQWKLGSPLVEIKDDVQTIIDYMAKVGYRNFDW